MTLHDPRITTSLKHGEKDPNEKDTPLRVLVFVCAVGVAPSESKSCVLQNEPMKASEDIVGKVTCLAA